MMKQDNSAEFLDAPHSEPQRQYYFIEKGHAFVDALRTELARPVTFAVTTFGCQMNARDSEKLTGILLALGYEPAESEDADFVILNTCTVRDNANMRVYGRLGILGGLKKKRPHMKIALCGCMMQDAAVVEKIRKSYRFVNLIFGTQNLYQFAELFVRMWGENKIVSVNFLNRNPNVTNSNIASTNNDNVFSNTDAILSSMDGIPPHTDVVSSKTDITSSKMLINPSERCAASAAFDHDDPP
ncbi:MAG: hypothetical protein LBM60_02880, partial [Clostridium sp.]|nr:hypothetical protein [Clostridium sp.]